LRIQALDGQLVAIDQSHPSHRNFVLNINFSEIIKVYFEVYLMSFATHSAGRLVLQGLTCLFSMGCWPPRAR
jgi:hypothetical protein